MLPCAGCCCSGLLLCVVRRSPVVPPYCRTTVPQRLVRDRPQREQRLLQVSWRQAGASLGVRSLPAQQGVHEASKPAAAAALPGQVDWSPHKAFSMRRCAVRAVAAAGWWPTATTPSPASTRRRSGVRRRGAGRGRGAAACHRTGSSACGVRAGRHIDSHTNSHPPSLPSSLPLALYPPYPAPPSPRLPSPPGSSVAYTRDQDVALDFPTLALALERVARGEVGAGRGAAHPTAHMCWWRGRGSAHGGGATRAAACAVWRPASAVACLACWVAGWAPGPGWEASWGLSG